MQRVAIVYDYLPSLGGGGERLLEELVNHFSGNVDLYFGFTVESAYSRGYLERIRNKIGKNHLHLGPSVRFFKTISFRLCNYLLPQLLQSLNLQHYDLVISLTAFLGHSIKPPVHGKHIIYFNTPARFLWNLTHTQTFLKKITGKFLVTDVMKYRSQLYDLSGVHRTRHLLSISRAVQNRVSSFYNLPSRILYPASVPAALLSQELMSPALREQLGNYYTHISRIESYKNIDLALDTWKHFGIQTPLVIMGDGPYMKTMSKKLRKMYGKPTPLTLQGVSHECNSYGPIILTGLIPEEKKFVLLATASAKLSLNDEDFGITKVEALATGTPVIALAAGAAPELISHEQNGILFSEATPEHLYNALILHESTHYKRTAIKQSAKAFTVEAFHLNLERLLHA